MATILPFPQQELSISELCDGMATDMCMRFLSEEIDLETLAKGIEVVARIPENHKQHRG